MFSNFMGNTFWILCSGLVGTTRNNYVDTKAKDDQFLTVFSDKFYM